MGEAKRRKAARDVAGGSFEEIISMDQMSAAEVDPLSMARDTALRLFAACQAVARGHPNCDGSEWAVKKDGNYVVIRVPRWYSVAIDTNDRETVLYPFGRTNP